MEGGGGGVVFCGLLHCYGNKRFKKNLSGTAQSQVY